MKLAELLKKLAKYERVSICRHKPNERKEIYCGKNRLIDPTLIENYDSLVVDMISISIDGYCLDIDVHEEQ